MKQLEYSDLSPIIMGTMRLGKWGANLNTRDWHEIIESCIGIGVTTFDHADIYGDYTTEGDFGKILKESPSLRDKIQIITKCGIRRVCENRPKHLSKSYDSSAKHLINSVNNSLRLLETEYIDLMLLHRPDLLMEPDEIAEAVNKLKKEGKIRAFGVSNFSPSQFELLDSRIGLFTNQIEASISHLKPFLDGTLDQSLRRKRRIMAWSPLGGGDIFGEKKTEKAQRIFKVASSLASKKGKSVDQILLAWLLTHPAGIIPVIGTTKITRVKSSLESFNIKFAREEWYELFKASTGEELA